MTRFLSLMRIQQFPFSQRAAMGQRGATLVEFALVSPILILIILGALQIGIAGWAKSTLENSLRDSARFAVTGADDVASGKTRADAILDLVEKRMSSFPKSGAAPMTLTTKVYPSFEEIGRPEPENDGNGVCDAGESYTDINGNGAFDADAFTTGYGAANQVVIYEVQFPLEAIIPLIGEFLPVANLFNLKASAAVQNEPFTGAAAPEPLVLSC
jgi:TadE-like protein